MGLGRKNLAYSMVLAGAMLLFLTGYFVYMLPSLYVDHVMEQNLKSVREQHNSYVENGTYEGVQVKNSTACFSIEIPTEGNYILITGKSFSVEVTILDERLEKVLDQLMEQFQEKEYDKEEMTAEFDISEEMDMLADIFRDALEGTELPVDIKLLRYWDTDEEFRNENIKMHFYSDTMLVEAGIEDSSNKYTNYVAIEQARTGMVLSFLPVMTPEMDEIRPIVLQSIPMLAAVVLLIVLLFSQMYSRGIVRPIVKLAQDTRQMKHVMQTAHATVLHVEPVMHKRADEKDEVQQLADILEDFYQQINESYHKLEKANKELAEENKRQEVFLRASSHQLKTPIAAALLLVDGMMNEIGRYKDTKVYLPKVKEQLLSMRKMVEDILYLNHCTEDIRFQQIEIGEVLKERVQCSQVAIMEKQLSVNFSGSGDMKVYTDERMISQVLDNLLSNAVKYTPEAGRIEISLCRREAEQEVRIENFGVTIPEELLPHIYEPFVSGNHAAKESRADSHGLGLYIASYYAGKLHCSISVGNGADSVVGRIVFRGRNPAD